MPNSGVASHGSVRLCDRLTLSLEANVNLQPVILAGGSGTRLWPLSREVYPKQFLSLWGERSLLQETLSRLDGIDGLADPIVVCNEDHRFLVAEQTRQIGKTPHSVILEPVGRNTAPALTLAALSLEGSSVDPVMLVTPADHIIGDVPGFQSVVRLGAALAEDGALVTFGILPDSPETGYGYIRKGEAIELPAGTPSAGEGNGVSTPHGVAAFVEKPDREAAEALLASEGYLWNSGIFMMRASVWLEKLKGCRPDIAEICGNAHAKGRLDGDFYRPDPDVFAACPSDSIDYAVMERIAGGSGASAAGSDETEDGDSSLETACVVIPMDAGWSDVGSWSVVWERGEPDSDGNVCQGDVYVRSTRNSLLLGQHRLVAAVGLEGVIVVETPDAVLVAHADQVQDVKALVAELREAGRSEQRDHRKVHRPWGSYETVDVGPRFQVKRLTVNPGEALSLQRHHHRAEHWVVVEGTAKVTRGDDELLLKEDESIYVPLGARHRLENPGKMPLKIIEVQSGSYLGEDDIERFDDRYDRHSHD